MSQDTTGWTVQDDPNEYKGDFNMTNLTTKRPILAQNNQFKGLQKLSIAFFLELMTSPTVILDPTGINPQCGQLI